jgi:hypothetical protein
MVRRRRGSFGGEAAVILTNALNRLRPAPQRRGYGGQVGERTGHQIFTEGNEGRAAFPNPVFAVFAIFC